MIINKNLNIIIIIFLIFPINFLNAEIKIIFNIDDEIITNYDLEKESNYLKILNPQLKNLEDDSVLKLSTKTLKNEIIKKKEIEKLKETQMETNLINEYIENLYSKLNIENMVSFEKYLINNKTYNIDELKEKIKIEFLWNKLIYLKYSKLVKIDYDKIRLKIKNSKNQQKKEFLLSEIIFSKKKNIPLNKYIDEIKLSINEIGFNNTANIYSISDSSKIGGKVGWVNENSLNKEISIKLELINNGEITDVIKLQNNFLILKKEDTRIEKIKLDKEKEFDKLVEIQTNKQLNRFSNIFLNKIQQNYSINEY